MEEGDASLKATDVFVGFLLLDQLREAALHDAGRPLVDQSLAVVVTPDNALDALRHSRKHKKQQHTHTVMWESLGAVLRPEEVRKNKTTQFCTKVAPVDKNQVFFLFVCFVSWKNSHKCSLWKSQPSYLLNDALSFIGVKGALAEGKQR